jgi:hypothetical protein
VPLRDNAPDENRRSNVGQAQRAYNFDRLGSQKEIPVE